MRVLILSCAVAALAVPASAGAVRPVPGLSDAFETTVDYSDLDIRRAAGADALILRIRQAARRVCDQPTDPRDLRGRARVRKACVSVAMENAVRAVDSPVVTTRFQRSRSPAMLAVR